MSRPKISPETAVEKYDVAYDDFRQIQPNRRLFKLAFAAFNGLTRPRMIYADDAVSDLDKINANNYPHIYVVNHLSGIANLLTIPVFDKVAPDDIGNTRWLGADINFDKWYSPVCVSLGMIPVYRRKDHPNVEYLRDVHEEMTNCSKDCLLDGQKIGVSPEGDSNYGNTARLMALGDSIGRIAHKAATEANTTVALTPYALSPGKHVSLVRPTVCVGRSVFASPDMTVEEIMEQTGNNLQDAVTIAHEPCLDC